MKNDWKWVAAVAAAAWTGLVGCARSGSGDRSEVVAEGVVFYVEYQTGGGGTTGFTRSDDSRGVPAGGKMNVDAYGRLTHDFLIITRPQRKDMGPLVIPVPRLVRVQFGDGGKE